jgi:hypothetical protein
MLEGILMHKTGDGSVVKILEILTITLIDPEASFYR